MNNEHKYKKEINHSTLKIILGNSTAIQGTLNCLAELIETGEVSLNPEVLTEQLRFCSLQAASISKRALETLHEGKNPYEQEETNNG